MSSLKFTLNNSHINVDTYHNTYYLPYPCINHTFCFPYVSHLPPGYYNLEVWGAQGGTYKADNRGGKGGYSRGILNLKTTTKAFFYVGASGIVTNELLVLSPTAFNGGGSGKSSRVDHASSGGGASDVRLVGESLYHRVIVAGGGGGSGQYGSDCIGGAGGGMNGINGMRCHPQSSGGTNGTQTNGGITTSQGINGAFGYGGNKTTWDGCGGGGGWFGGGAGSAFISAGGGGSGFVFNTDTFSNARNQGLVLSKSFLLSNSITLSGEEEFPAFKSFDNETGHELNGAIAITLLQYNHCTYQHISKSYVLTCLFFILIK
jgi:hypothetical protein